ncbi:hypothetical protein [Alicyclobacillus mengziensis]|nr:hypothetical protein [Alicyclobacillus mengziensis]
MTTRKKYARWYELGVLLLFFGATPLLYKFGYANPPDVKETTRPE